MTIAVKDKNSKGICLTKNYFYSQWVKSELKKSEGMLIGSLKNNVEQPFGIKWPKTPIKDLGIYHSYDKILSLLKQLHWWKARNLSVTGKILIVKSLGLSKYALLSSLVSVPQTVNTKYTLPFTMSYGMVKQNK